MNPNGDRWEVQIKGAGLTPFSRTADGRKVLRSSIREYLCSEAAFFLNLPTTRAGTVITSSTTVMRDPLYNGTVIDEQCAVVSRIAPNFFRFGSFEIFKEKAGGMSRVGPSAGNKELKKQLLEHTLKYFPDIWAKAGQDDVNRYKHFYAEIVSRTAVLVAR